MPRSRRETAIIYAETRLEQWGRWSRDNPGTLGLPRVSIIHKVMRRRLVRGPSRNKGIVTAKGKETLSFRPRTVDSMPEAVAEVDVAVAKLASNLQLILKIEYVDMSHVMIEDRCVAARVSRRRYNELLECAKYSIFAALNT